jgi:hypothetical protein
MTEKKAQVDRARAADVPCLTRLQNPADPPDLADLTRLVDLTSLVDLQNLVGSALTGLTSQQVLANRLDLAHLMMLVSQEAGADQRQHILPSLLIRQVRHSAQVRHAHGQQGRRAVMPHLSLAIGKAGRRWVSAVLNINLKPVHLHAHGQPDLRVMNAQEMNAQKASVQEASVQEMNVQGVRALLVKLPVTSAQETSAQEMSAQEMSVRLNLLPPLRVAVRWRQDHPSQPRPSRKPPQQKHSQQACRL